GAAESIGFPARVNDKSAFRAAPGGPDRASGSGRPEGTRLLWCPEQTAKDRWPSAPRPPRASANSHRGKCHPRPKGRGRGSRLTASAREIAERAEWTNASNRGNKHPGSEGSPR